MAELKHHGILGMKWGVRNDGSGSGSAHPDHSTAAALRKKKPSELSNQELAILTKRMQLEKQYKELSISQMSAGQKWLANVLLSIGTTTVSSYATKGINSGVSAIFDHATSNAS